VGHFYGPWPIRKSGSTPSKARHGRKIAQSVPEPSALSLLALNRAKSDKVTERAWFFTKELYEAKLLSQEGWERVSGISRQ
jgi:hypothetical protein